MMDNPYEIVKHMLVSEKASVLMGLKDSESSASLKRFKKPKYVFVVDMNANKKQIKMALEEIYKKKSVSVVSVNTIISKSKPRIFRGRFGKTKPYKKAIVTFKEGDSIDEQA